MATDTHHHKSVRDWIMLFEGLDEEHSLLVSCAPAREAWTLGMVPWLEHATTCATCRRIARVQGLFTADSLDCAECRNQLQVVYDLVDVAEHYEPVTVLELQRAEASIEELSSLPLDEQAARVRSEHPFQQWGLAQQLLLQARAAWHRDPELAHDRALLAVVVTQTLDPDSYSTAWISDLEAKAHAYLGNAHRILGHFAETETEFLLAEACLREGVRSGRAEARVFALKVSLLKDQHRHAEALALLAQVERFYAEHGEDHEVGRLALKRSTILDLQGDPRAAADECTRAAKLVEAAQDPELPLVARNNSISFLLAAGETARARALFDELPPMPEPLSELERLWLEGTLLRTEGRHPEAREVFDRVRDGFADAGLFYRAALASLDLALTAYFQSGHTGEVVALAERAAVHLTLAGAKPEAHQAIRLLLRSLHEGALSRAVLERVRRISPHSSPPETKRPRCLADDTPLPESVSDLSHSGLLFALWPPGPLGCTRYARQHFIAPRSRTLQTSFVALIPRLDQSFLDFHRSMAYCLLALP